MQAEQPGAAGYGPVELGRTGIRISPLGLGTWQWGDYFVWKYGRGYGDADLSEAFDVSLQAGVNFVDTAEIYGRGRSERLVGECLHRTGAPVVVATKFMPLPWRWRGRALVAALRDSLARLGLGRVDLYQIHWPFGPRPVEVWAGALADAVEAGLTRAVGVSNFSADQMARAHEVLAARGVALASNQVEYNLLNRKVETNGVASRCRDLGVTLIAYSPLAKGLLTGKYGPANPPPGLRRRLFHPADLAAVERLTARMREIGAGRGQTPSQVALNWLMAKGAVPIPGAKNARQAADNAAAMAWRLKPEEADELDRASAAVSRA